MSANSIYVCSYYGYVMLDYIYLPVTTALRRSIKVFSYFYNIVQTLALGSSSSLHPIWGETPYRTVQGLHR
jgi:hypothetical protein